MARRLLACIHHLQQQETGAIEEMSEVIAIFKTNNEKIVAVWRKYLRGATEDVLDESYPSTVGELEQVPMPSLPPAT